jgi:hypothetical protein
MDVDQNVIDWLVNSDPSIVFQAKRDILGLPKHNWINDQNKILTKGWGKKLLDLQDESGRWGVIKEGRNEKEYYKAERGLYGPKYISTHYTLLLLKRMEMPPNPQTSKGCRELSKLSYFQSVYDSSLKQRDLCIPGMILGIFAHFREGEEYFEELLGHFEDNKTADGGWNCRSQKKHAKSTHHFSVNTTLNILEGLAALAKNYPKYHSQVHDLAESANEVLLTHKLFKSHRTGEIIHLNFTEITFPPRWRYNILSAMDYFQSIGFPYDERMEDALEIIRHKEKKGFWSKGKQISGLKYFSLDPPRSVSSFNTLRALRVLIAYSEESRRITS